MQKWLIPMILAAALIFSGLLSILSIHSLQGNARIINYTGVVRGATQRLVKQELIHQPDDALIARVEGILSELSTGAGENGLDRLEDEIYQALLGQMRAQWEKIKAEIQRVRSGGDAQALYALSEDYFSLADRTVSAAEAYSERQVDRAEAGLLVLNAVFLLLAALLAWYGAVQSRRQKELAQAEDANKVRGEHLQRMSEDLRAPLNEISELMYVSDIESYELLFLNEAGKKSFGVAELTGQKCYRVLRGFNEPCSFCTNPHLTPGSNYTWETTNPITKRHYLLKDRLIQWEGRPARLEIAFDTTEAEAEKQAIKSALDTEQMVMECVRTLYQERDFGQSIPAVLERLGRHLGADRAYLIAVRNGLLYDDYEWCGEGVSSRSRSSQSLPIASIASWLPAFSRKECILLEDVEDLRGRAPGEYALLRGMSVQRLVATPLEQDGQLWGLLGVDNPPRGKMRGASSLLQTLRYYIMLTYRRTESERQLSHLSYCDTLTSFYNRNRYIEDTEALAGSDLPVGIVFLDVNGLKSINDRQGHDCGDKALVTCSQQIREVFREADHYRIGGDEFVILCPGMKRAAFQERVSALRSRFGQSGPLRVAIGAQWADRFRDELIAKADAEMYEDKKAFYRNNPLSHRYRHHSDELLHLSDPNVLQDEILQQRFVVYLQPKISSADHSVVGAEALVRYQSRSGSLVLPGHFLPLLEESQAISQIDFYVFEYACSRFREWASQGKQPLPVAVNFSRCSLSQPDFVSRLTGLCEKYGVAAGSLEIDLTETVQDADGLDLKSLVRDLREAGFLISIGDFGAECANLALLTAVEFDVLKLDKSLVDDVARRPKARAVVESTVDACRKMGIQVVAEGIETEEQLSALRSCGVELVQGFLFSKPIPIEEYEEKYLRTEARVI